MSIEIAWCSAAAVVEDRRHQEEVRILLCSFSSQRWLTCNLQEPCVRHSPRLFEEEQFEPAEDRCPCEQAPVFDNEFRAVQHATFTCESCGSSGFGLDEASATDFHERAIADVYIERRRRRSLGLGFRVGFVSAYNSAALSMCFLSSMPVI